MPEIPEELTPPPTDRVVTLRAWNIGDVDAITRACSDPVTQRGALVPENYDEGHARAFIAASEDRRRTAASLEVAVVDARDHHQVLGAVGLVSIDWRHERAEVGYWTAPGARRRGVATRAVRLLSAWAFSELGLARLDLMPLVENVASHGVADQAGYTREGVLRSFHKLKHRRVDIVMFSLLPGDLDG
jgi:ribosomal-protein-alanine N-acetyltransferase